MGFNLNKLLTKAPWTIIPLIKLKELGGDASASEIAGELGVRSQLVKRAMWWLRKYGFVEENVNVEPKRFKLKNEAYKAVEKLLINRWVKGNTTVILRGKVFYIFIVRERKIIVKTISKDIIDYARKVSSERKLENVKDVTEALKIPLNLASIVLRVLRTTS